jgi:hypothetical protein
MHITVLSCRIGYGSSNAQRNDHGERDEHADQKLAKRFHGDSGASACITRLDRRVRVPMHPFLLSGVGLTLHTGAQVFSFGRNFVLTVCDQRGWKIRMDSYKPYNEFWNWVAARFRVRNARSNSSLGVQSA